MTADHHHPAELAPVEARVAAIESVLVEKGILDTDALDAIVQHFEDNLGPMNGAKVVARAWSDPAYRERLLADGTTEIEAVAKKGALGESRLVVDHLSVISRAGSVAEVSLSVRAGECVGLVGLDGSGSATVADAIVGLLKPHSGTISINGAPARPGKVDAAFQRGVGYVPQDRHARGFAPQLGVAENLTLTMLGRLASRLGLVSFRERDALAEKQISNLQIVAHSLAQLRAASWTLPAAPVPARSGRSRTLRVKRRP